MVKRLLPIIEKLESGEPITQDELNRVAALQALDIVLLGQEYIEQQIEAEDQADEQFRQQLEAN